jgi:hypothetical protein
MKSTTCNLPLAECCRPWSKLETDREPAGVARYAPANEQAGDAKNGFVWSKTLFLNPTLPATETPAPQPSPGYHRDTEPRA